MTHPCIALVVVALSLVACPNAAAQDPLPEQQDPPSNITPPQVTGTPADGATLTAHPGAWSGTPPLSFEFEWGRCNVDGQDCDSIATGDAYTLKPEDVGTTFRVRVTASNAAGEGEATSPPTAVVEAVAPVNIAPPVVTGMPREGQVLSASRGDWTGTPPLELHVQWERCNAGGADCVSIPGAASDSHVLSSADVGTRLVVAVTASNVAGTVTIRSALTRVVAPEPLTNIRPPEIVGVARVGESLRATTGRWAPSGPTDFLYRWLRCRADGSDCTPVPGAVSASYEVRALDVGSRLRVRVTAISDAGSSSKESALTSVVTVPLGVIAPGQAPPKLMRPFPRVRIQGYFTRSGAVLQLVTVRGPRVARIAVSCWGRDCPYRERARPLRRRIRIRSLERSFRAGTRIVVRVTKPRRIGKHTRIVIRAGRPPARRDRCLMPGLLAPVRCARP